MQGFVCQVGPWVMQVLCVRLGPGLMQGLMCQVGPWTNARFDVSGWALGRPRAGEAPGREPAWYPAHRLALLAASTLQHPPCQAYGEVSSPLTYCLRLILIFCFFISKQYYCFARISSFHSLLACLLSTCYSMAPKQRQPIKLSSQSAYYRFL